MFESLRKLLRGPKQVMDESAERYLMMAPHGQILVLDLAESRAKLKSEAISDKLMKFAGRPTSFVGVLIDLKGVDYRLSSADVGSIAATIAAWERGWVAPCAVVMTGAAAAELEKVLALTRLNQLSAAPRCRHDGGRSTSHQRGTRARWRLTA